MPKLKKHEIKDEHTNYKEIKVGRILKQYSNFQNKKYNIKNRQTN
jgi:hypothetical protein